MKLGKKMLFFAAILLGLVVVVLAISGNVIVSLVLKRQSTNTKSSEDKPTVLDSERAEALGWLETTKYKKVTYTTEDEVDLCAYRIYQEQPTHRYAIVLHGYHSDKERHLSYAKQYYEHGFEVLVPDQRAHGESGGAYTGMGWLEKDDLIGWINTIAAKDDSAEIVVHGFSMGASTVMMAAGEPNFPFHVVAAVEDCGYTSVWDCFTIRAKEGYHLPKFPLLYMADLMSQLRIGVDFKEASAFRQVRRCKIPMLFIHGEEDTYIPFSMVQELYDNAICQKELYTVPNAGHVQAARVGGQEYWDRVFQFLDKYMKGTY